MTLKAVDVRLRIARKKRASPRAVCGRTETSDYADCQRMKQMDLSCMVRIEPGS